MNNGFPTQHVIPFSEVVLLPNQIDTSTDGSVATTFEFDVVGSINNPQINRIN